MFLAYVAYAPISAAPAQWRSQGFLRNSLRYRTACSVGSLAN
jgi:hypothetical protein